MGVPTRLALNLGGDEAIERFARKLRCVGDGPALPDMMSQQLVQQLFEESRLLASPISLDGSRGDLDDVTMPVVLVLGTEDAFVPRASGVSYWNRSRVGTRPTTTSRLATSGRSSRRSLTRSAGRNPSAVPVLFASCNS